MEPFDRLQPPRGSAAYGHLSELSGQLRTEVDRLVREQHRRELTVVDIGCGECTYRSLFPASTTEYIGIDIDEAVSPDHLADAHELPVSDGTADLVLCLQTLHYLHTPATAIGEAWRVLKPGGTALYSTHGIAYLQLRNSDYHRWTHLGLDHLFQTSADWESVLVQANGGAAASVAYLIGGEIEAVTGARPMLRRAGAAVITVLNAIAGRLDRAYERRHPGRQPHGAPNYLVIARRGS